MKSGRVNYDAKRTEGNPPVVLHFPTEADLDGPGQIVWDMRPDNDGDEIST